jgi:hypothetical protein
MKNQDPYGERKSAKKKGGRVQPNSGRFWAAKGDLVANEDLIDRKETRHESYRIDIQLWKQLMRDAHRYGKSPALEICFTSHQDITMMVITEERYRELNELAQLSTSSSDNAKTGTGETSTEKRSMGEVFHTSKERIGSILSSLKPKQ